MSKWRTGNDPPNDEWWQMESEGFTYHVQVTGYGVLAWRTDGDSVERLGVHKDVTGAKQACLPKPNRFIFGTWEEHCCDRCLGGKMRQWMILCPTCGNKRCPKASFHDNECTGSNEPGQEGSVY